MVAKRIVNQIVCSLDGERWMHVDGTMVRELADGDSTQIVTDLADQIENHASPVVLAIPSAWCFTCTVSLPDVNANLLNDLIKSEAELQFPMGIESLLYWVHRSDESAFVIAADQDRVHALFAAFEQAGHRVRGVVPAACMLAAQAVGTDASMAVLIRDRRSIESITLKSGLATQWTHRKLLDENSLGDQNIDTLYVQTPCQLGVSWSVHRDEMSALAKSYKDIEQLLLVAAGSGINCLWSAREIRIQGKCSSAFQRFVQLAIPIAIVLLILIVGVHRRSTHLRQDIIQHQSAQRVGFQSIRPSSPIPSGIADRMQSLLHAAQKQGQAEFSLPASILGDLHDLLIALPDPDRHEIDAFRLSDEAFQIIGTAPRHEDTSRLTGMIRSIPSGRFTDTGSPRIDLLPDGRVRFWIEATLANTDREGRRP